MATMEDPRIAALKAEIEAEQTSALEGEVFDGKGGIYLTIRDEEFECRRVSVSWQMMQFAKAQRAANLTVPSGLPKDSPKRKEIEEKRSAAGMKMMSLLLDTINVLLKPHERERFEEYMDEISADGLEQGEREDAIGSVIAAVGGEQGKAERTTSTQSSASSQTTSENAQVVSFKRGTDGMLAVEKK